MTLYVGFQLKGRLATLFILFLVKLVLIIELYLRLRHSELHTHSPPQCAEGYHGIKWISLNHKDVHRDEQIDISKMLTSTQEVFDTNVKGLFVNTFSPITVAAVNVEACVFKRRV